MLGCHIADGVELVRSVIEACTYVHACVGERTQRTGARNFVTRIADKITKLYTGTREKKRERERERNRERSGKLPARIRRLAVSMLDRTFKIRWPIRGRAKLQIYSFYRVQSSRSLASNRTLPVVRILSTVE